MFATCAAVNGHGKTVLGDKIKTLRVVKTMACNVQVRLRLAPQRTETIQTEFASGNLASDLGSERLDTSTMGCQQYGAGSLSMNETLHA